MKYLRSKNAALLLALNLPHFYMCKTKIIFPSKEIFLRPFIRIKKKFMYFIFIVKDFGKVFVEALKTEPDDLKVKELFGEHIRKSHESCSEKKLEFVKAAHKSGKYVNKNPSNF